MAHFVIAHSAGVKTAPLAEALSDFLRSCLAGSDNWIAGRLMDEANGLQQSERLSRTLDYDRTYSRSTLVIFALIL
jgi:hypothetical protein